MKLLHLSIMLLIAIIAWPISLYLAPDWSYSGVKLSVILVWLTIAIYFVTRKSKNTIPYKED